jgi:hypothetical protein
MLLLTVVEKGLKDMKKSFKTACTKSGIKNFRFHYLRGTCCSHIVMSNLDLVKAKDLIRHRCLAMVLCVGLAPKRKVKLSEVFHTVLNGM